MANKNLGYVEEYVEALGTGNQAIAYLKMCVERGIVPDSKMIKRIEEAQGGLIQEAPKVEEAKPESK
jgi:hypothetical protein